MQYVLRRDLMKRKSNFVVAAVVLAVVSAFVFCSTVTLASPQDGSSNPEVSIRSSRSSVQIADPFEAIVQVTASSGATVQFPTVPPQLGPFVVIDHRDLFGVPNESNDGTSKWTRRLTLETLETGEFQIPAMEVLVRYKDQPLERLVTEPVDIQIASVLEPASDPGKFADIHDLIDVPVPKGSPYGWIVWVAAVGLGLSALVAGALIMFRGRTTWTTPSNWAIGEIFGLASNSAESFSRLEQIVRTYIEEEFHVPATSYSPLELQQRMLQRGASQATAQQLLDFLTKSEQAKYAGLDVSDSEFINAKESVLETIKGLDSIPHDAILEREVVSASAEVV